MEEFLIFSCPVQRLSNFTGSERARENLKNESRHHDITRPLRGLCNELTLLNM